MPTAPIGGPRHGGIDVASLQDWLFDRLRVDKHVARVLIEVSEEEGDGVQWVVRVNTGGPHWWEARVTPSDVEGEESELAVALLGAVEDQELFERGMLQVHGPERIAIDCPYCGGELLEEPGKHDQVRGWRCPNCGE